MTLILHGFDGRDVHIEPSAVVFISETHIGGRLCTRIELRSGDDVVVREPESVLKAALTESER